MEQFIKILKTSGKPASETANRSAVDGAVLSLLNLRSDETNIQPLTIHR